MIRNSQWFTCANKAERVARFHSDTVHALPEIQARWDIRVPLN